MLALILKFVLPGLEDAALKAIFTFIANLMEQRNLIAQGKAAQYTADLQATVKDATDASQIRETVQAEPISAVDADLQRLRDNAARS